MRTKSTNIQNMIKQAGLPNTPYQSNSQSANPNYIENNLQPCYKKRLEAGPS